jgi:mono/diheme cytochrome c family protein
VKARDARLLVVAVALMVRLGPLVAQSDRVREHDPDWTAPSKDAGKSNPLGQQANVVAGGRKLYGQRCNTCHGDEGRGTSRAPSLVAADVQAQTDGALFWKITGGNTLGGMPSFSFLPEAQRWQLVLHLRTLSREEHRPEPDHR